MKSKKLTLLVLSAVVSASVLAGCAPKKQLKQGAEGAPTEPVVVEVWHHWGSEQRRPTINGMLEEFNKQYKDKNIQVKGTFVPWDEIGKKLTASIAAGNPPNAAVQPIEAVGIKAARKQVEDITDYLPADIKDKYYENLWQTVLYNGRIYALPYNTDTRLVFYNKTLFAEAGINEFPTTWDGLFAAADKLDKKEGGKYTRLGFLPLIGNFGFDTIALSNNGGTFDDLMNPKVPTINRKENVEALDFMKKWVDRYGMDTVNAWKNAGSGANDPFISGKVAMFGNVNNYIATLQKYAPDMAYGVAPLPAGPSAQNPGAQGGGFVVEVPKGAKNIKESVEFVKFMTGDWATTKWALEQRDVMINKAANENEELKKNPAWQGVIDMMKNTYVTRRHPFAPDAGGAVGKAVDEVTTVGNKTAQQALDEAQAAVEKMIKDNEAISK